MGGGSRQLIGTVASMSQYQCLFVDHVQPGYGATKGQRLLDSVTTFTSVVQILSYETVASAELRRKRAKEIYDKCIYADMLAMSSAVSERWRVKGGGWRVEGGGWRVEGGR